MNTLGQLPDEVRFGLDAAPLFLGQQVLVRVVDSQVLDPLQVSVECIAMGKRIDRHNSIIICDTSTISL